MAFIRCESGGGGGVITSKTPLWNNPSPNESFSAQDVQLSQPFTNFALIGVTYKTQVNEVETYDVIMFSSDFLKTHRVKPAGAGTQWNTANLSFMDVYGTASTSTTYARTIRRANNTDEVSVKITNCGKVVTSDSATGSTVNTRCIPVQIFGVG